MKKIIFIVFFVLLVPIGLSFFYFTGSDPYDSNLKLYFKFDNNTLTENITFSSSTSKKNLTNSTPYILTDLDCDDHFIYTVNTSASDFVESMSFLTSRGDVGTIRMTTFYHYNDSSTEDEIAYIPGYTNQRTTITNPYPEKGVNSIDVYMGKHDNCNGYDITLTGSNTTVFNGTVTLLRQNTTYLINGLAGWTYKLKSDRYDIFNSYHGTETDIFYGSEGVYFNNVSSMFDMGDVLDIRDDNLTICARFRAVNMNSGIKAIVGKTNSTTDGRYGMALDNSTGTLQTYGFFDVGAAVSCITTDGLDIGVVNDVCMVINRSNTLKMYINGGLNKTCDLSSDAGDDYDTGISFTVGAYGSPSNYFNGTIEYALVYNWTLTDEQILDLHNNGSFAPNILNEPDTAINFTGTDAVFLKSNLFTETDFASGITIAGFYKVAPSSLNYQLMTDLEGVIGMGVYKNTNLYQVFLTTGTTVLYYQVDDVTQWHHLAMTYDRSSLKMYVDGDLVNSTAFSSDTGIDGVSKLSGVGGLIQGAGNDYSGLMDDVTVFNYALSEAQIQSIYNQKLGLGQKRNLILIDEKTRELFVVSNLTYAKVFNDDSNESYNFKSTNTNNISIGFNESVKLRFEFISLAGDVIIRYIDTNLSTGDLRICVNKDNVQHYPQLIVSHSTNNAAAVKSVYADCLVGEDYTRFVYQTYYMFQVYTIQTQYYLYKYNDDVPVFLASMDGSIENYYDLDALEFSQNEYNIQITGDTLAFNKSNTTVTIYYYNLGQDSVSTNIVLERLNTSTILLNVTNTTNPNEFYLVFDYSTLENVSNMELFKIEVTTTDAEGVESTIVRYFNTLAKSGIMPSALVFTISLLLIVFGLTLVSLQYALGWFGALVMIVGIGILGFGVLTWYTLLLMGVEFIILIYIIANLVYKNIGTVV